MWAPWKEPAPILPGEGGYPTSLPTFVKLLRSEAPSAERRELVRRTFAAQDLQHCGLLERAQFEAALHRLNIWPTAGDMASLWHAASLDGFFVSYDGIVDSLFFDGGAQNWLDVRRATPFEKTARNTLREGGVIPDLLTGLGRPAAAASNTETASSSTPSVSESLPSLRPLQQRAPADVRLKGASSAHLDSRPGGEGAAINLKPGAFCLPKSSMHETLSERGRGSERVNDLAAFAGSARRGLNLRTETECASSAFPLVTGRAAEK